MGEKKSVADRNSKEKFSLIPNIEIDHNPHHPQNANFMQNSGSRANYFIS